LRSGCLVGFEDQDFAIRFDRLVAALHEHLTAILGQVLHFTRPASHRVEKLHKVCRFDGVDRAQQLVGVLAQRLFAREAIKLFSAPVPVDILSPMQTKIAKDSSIKSV
jgi:hypothetical protein